MAYHVLNRGNGRQAVFRQDGDYLAFLDVVAEACRRPGTANRGRYRGQATYGRYRGQATY